MSLSFFCLSTTLFLIAGPEVLHAGSPTPIAVTVFSDFPGSLTAEVSDGNTKVAQKGDFQGGEPTVLQIQDWFYG